MLSKNNPNYDHHKCEGGLEGSLQLAQVDSEKVGHWKH